MRKWKLAREKRERKRLMNQSRVQMQIKHVDKLIEETQKDEAAGSNLSKDDDY